MSTVGVILSTVGDVQYHGGYHDARGGYLEYRDGCSVPWGTQITKYFSPHGTEHPHGTHDIPHMHHDIPHGTEHPPRYSR